MFNSNDVILLVLLLASVVTSIGYLVSVHQAAKQLPRIDLSEIFDNNDPAVQSPTVSVIIPAYNEEDNIAECVKSILTSTQLSEEHLDVWVVDDQSTDRTLEILQTLQLQLADPRLKILSGLPRPNGQVWTGKNWACQQGADRAKGDFFLFIDADVRLKPKSISAVIQTALDRQLDFLTCVPTIVCGSLIEWLVQPLMFINLIVTFNSEIVKDPTTKTTYALGPFLLFRSSIYRAIGGHQAIADQPAEDVALARNIKHQGFRLQQFLGAELASLRMYQNWTSLWEGWTKVLYIGAQRSVSLMALLVVVMLLIYTIPWISLIIAIFQCLQAFTTLHYLEFGLAVLTILLQYWIRQTGAQALGSSTKYWWLQGIGGLLVAVLAIASIIKTETGWGWTWRGRKLTLPKKV